MLDLKECSNAKKFLEKTGYTLDQAIEQLEKEITGVGNRNETRNDNSFSG